MYNDDAGNGISYSQLLAFFCFILLFGLLFFVVVVVVVVVVFLFFTVYLSTTFCRSKLGKIVTNSSKSHDRTIRTAA